MIGRFHRANDGTLTLRQQHFLGGWPTLFVCMLAYGWVAFTYGDRELHRQLGVPLFMVVPFITAMALASWWPGVLTVRRAVVFPPPPSTRHYRERPRAWHFTWDGVMHPVAAITHLLVYHHQVTVRTTRQPGSSTVVMSMGNALLAMTVNGSPTAVMQWATALARHVGLGAFAVRTPSAQPTLIEVGDGRSSTRSTLANTWRHWLVWSALIGGLVLAMWRLGPMMAPGGEITSFTGVHALLLVWAVLTTLGVWWLLVKSRQAGVEWYREPPGEESIVVVEASPT